MAPALSAAVIGGGPAGLMAAEVLSRQGIGVDLYEAMPSVGRKFLRAGVGGLNLTHSEPEDVFAARYGERRAFVRPWLRDFGPTWLQAWATELGADTFIGTSGRVFPKEMKAAPLLRAWLRRLRHAGVRFHLRHRWMGWEGDALLFATPEDAVTAKPDVTLLALGGGSWARLGSDGAWVPLLTERGVGVEPLKPANCGFDVDWSEHFRERYAGAPVKSVTACFGDGERIRGEFVVTRPGVEGGLIYTLSSRLRDTLETRGEATLHLDLAPDRDLDELRKRLSKPRGSQSLANHLRKQARIAGVKAGLLREVLDSETLADPARVAATIKSFPLRLTAIRPLDEAISSAGGVRPDSLDERLMLSRLPGVFCAGEMLDWEAPTGGYLLTACFASGAVAAHGAAGWLRARSGA